MRTVQTSRKNESLLIGPVDAKHVQRTFNNRKHSVVVPSSKSKKLSLLDVEEDGNDYAPAFRKKMSMPVASQLRQRAHSTLQYANSAINTAPRLTTTAEPTTRAGIRFKKVGNLMTLEQSNPSGHGRTSSLTKMGGPNNNLFMRNVFNEQNNG